MTLLQTSLEMMLPVPKWAQDKELDLLLQGQTETQVEDIFGQTYDFTIDTKLVLDIRRESLLSPVKQCINSQLINVCAS